MANGTLYNDYRLANSTEGQATQWLKEAFGLTEASVPSSLDPHELLQARFSVPLVHYAGLSQVRL